MNVLMKSCVVSTLALAACATAPKAPPPPPPVEPPPPPVETVAPPEEAQAIDPAEYRRDFLLGASQYFSGRKQRFEAKTSSVAPPHEIVVVKTVGGDKRHIILTCGLGRIARPHLGLDAEHRHVELVAYSQAFGPKIGEILSAIAEHLHETRGPTWKTYDTISLPKPLHGLQHFDLRPGGEVDVGDNMTILLYKVVPLSPDELEKTKAEGGSQWVDSAAADPSVANRELLRWAPALAD